MGEGSEDPRPNSEEGGGVGPIGTTSTDFFRSVLTLVRAAEAFQASSRAFLTAVLWRLAAVQLRPPTNHLSTTDSAAVTSPRP